MNILMGAQDTITRKNIEEGVDLAALLDERESKWNRFYTCIFLLLICIFLFYTYIFLHIHNFIINMHIFVLHIQFFDTELYVVLMCHRQLPLSFLPPNCHMQPVVLYPLMLVV